MEPMCGYMELARFRKLKCQTPTMKPSKEPTNFVDSWSPPILMEPLEPIFVEPTHAHGTVGAHFSRRPRIFRVNMGLLHGTRQFPPAVRVRFRTHQRAPRAAQGLGGIPERTAQCGPLGGAGGEEFPNMCIYTYEYIYIYIL